MDATFTNSGFILKEETADDVWIFEATFAPANQPNNVGRNERTISVEPLVDAPIVPIKSAEPKTKSHAQITQEVNFVPLLFAGLMIGCISFSVGQMVGYYQGSISRMEANN